jgi:hypothetical protein
MTLQSHPRFVRALCAIAGSLAAGYLWAVASGDGIPGLKDSAALDKSAYYPAANVAFIAAIGSYLLSPLVAAWADGVAIAAPRYLGRWFAATALLGACLFALSRPFV